MVHIQQVQFLEIPVDAEVVAPGIGLLLLRLEVKEVMVETEMPLELPVILGVVEAVELVLRLILQSEMLLERVEIR